ncbi:MAG: hypothetical protein DYG92_13580 [Leptolyngbya sp. PLA1]|nr:hypothetical protein [Leptolyngbya sp. PLA1]
MQVDACPGCGAGFAGDPFAAKWRCGQCGRENLNHQVIRARLDKIDHARAMTLLDLGKIEFKSGNYPRALERFESALCEKADSAEPWAFVALASARAATADTFDAAASKLTQCLERAGALEPGSAFVSAVSCDCHTAMTELAMRTIRERVPQAQAYLQSPAGQTPQGRAWASGAIAAVMNLVARALSLQASDPAFRYQLAMDASLLASQYGALVPGAQPHLQYAQGIAAQIRAQHPGVAARVDALYKKPSGGGGLILWIILIVVVLLVLMVIVASTAGR